MNGETMNIAISISDGFMMPAKVMLHSLFSGTQQPVHLFLLCQSLSRQNRDELAQLVRAHGGEYTELCVDAEAFADASLDHNPLYSVEIYYRILLPYLTEVPRMLWLDADIVIRGDIRALYQQDIADCWLGAVTDLPETQGKRTQIKQQLGIPEQTYFNSGVLLMNLDQIRREIPKERFFEAIRQFNPILKCPDQDILNYVLGGKTRILPVTFNDQRHTQLRQPEDSLVLHYIWSKPWNADYAGYWDAPFWKAARDCGFARQARQYRNTRRMKYLKNELLPAVRRKLGGK